MPIVRTLISLVLFFGALVGSCMGIRAMQPFPKVLGVYQKWLYFKRNQKDIDLLFIGSSRIYHAAIPPQFDAQVKAATGREVRSFNLAYDAMWPPESLYMTRQILSMKSPRLKWVVLEVLDIFPDLNEQTRFTRRTAYWHDWRHTAMTWQALQDQKFLPLRAWELATTHGEILLKNWTNQGLGAEELGYQFGVERRKRDTRWEAPKEWKDEAGYQPEDDQKLSGKEKEEYLRGLAARQKSLPASPINPSLKKAYDDIIAAIRAAGVEPILVITPTVRGDENVGHHFPGTTVWSYHDPNRYPELFDPANRHDVTHLSPEGAKHFTDLLAKDFAEYLKNRP